MTLQHALTIFTLSCLLISPISTTTAAAAAQATASQATENSASPETVDAEQEKKALALLDDVLTDARSLRLIENRVRVQSVAAELLWTRDEKRARALFKAAMDDLAELMRGIDSSDQQQYWNQIQVASQLRMEMLNTVARRDASLALDFLRATHQPPPQTDPNSKQPDPDAQLELNLANQLASTDPKRALEIARQALAKGVSYDLPNLISQLQAKDKDAAQSLMSDAVQKLRSEDLSTDQQALSVAANFLRMSVPPRAGEMATVPGQASVNNGASLIDQRTGQDLANMLADAGLKTSARSQSILWELQNILPQIEKYAPQRAAALRRRISDYIRTLEPQMRAWREYQDVIQQGTVDALLDVAAKAPPEMRATLYERAAQKALNEKDDDARARQIINDKIENPAQRKQLLGNLEQQVMWKDAQQGRLERARQQLDRLRPADRAALLIQFAAAFTAKDDKKSALQLLQEAQVIVSNRAENYQQMQIQLQLVGAFATIEPSRSFEIIAPLIDQLNELATAAFTLNGFENIYFKDGELSTQGQSQLSNMFQTCEQQIGEFAQTDFELAKSAADRFQRNEARVMARLFIAQNLLLKANAAMRPPSSGRSFISVKSYK